ncbi:MAG TPA: hypothetical protein VFT59_00245, partial [Candidatus Saccharimonadales bacterium]|nr:hypothetical protein [Candidatus Saccharimonadales bacterium]
DASAHSSYRLIRNPRSGYIEPAVQPDDAQLTFLFERHRNGAVTLTPDRCDILLQALPGVNRLRHLLTNELSPYAREDDVFNEVLTQKLTRHQDATRYIPELGGAAIWLNDGPNALGHDTVRILENQGYGKTMSRTTSYRGDGFIDRMYYLPGDGRIWGRFIGGSSIHPHFFSDYIQPEEYQHPDPAVTAMQRNVQETAMYNEKDNIGRPLTLQEAWQVINDAENVL